MDSSTISGIVFFLFGAAVFVYGIVLYKGLARLRNQNDRAWADIDALLKQRYDEIPNLLESVKGCMRHEQSTLLAVTEACASSMSAATIREKAWPILKSRARCTACLSLRRTIHNSKPTKTSSRCEVEWPNSKNASTNAASLSTKTSLPTTHVLGRSLTYSWPASWI